MSSVRILQSRFGDTLCLCELTFMYAVQHRESHLSRADLIPKVPAKVPVMPGRLASRSTGIASRHRLPATSSLHSNLCRSPLASRHPATFGKWRRAAVVLMRLHAQRAAAPSEFHPSGRPRRSPCRSCSGRHLVAVAERQAVALRARRLGARRQRCAIGSRASTPRQHGQLRRWPLQHSVRRRLRQRCSTSRRKGCR